MAKNQDLFSEVQEAIQQRDCCVGLKKLLRQSVLAAFEAWFQKGNVDGKSAGLIRDYLQSVDWKSGDLVDQVIPGIEMGSQDVSSFVEMLAEAKAGQKVQTSHLLDNGSADDFVTGHVRLLYGRWLARNELFDESLEELEKLDVDQVLAPATLLYYRGLMEHQLLKPKACIKTLSRLLENSDHLPRRYNVLAKLMLADMKRMEKDSLDEISRMMGDIRRRTDLNRSGTRVRGKEEDVVNKLDKLIERLEEQRQQMQMAAQGSNQSSSPADREQRMAGQATLSRRHRRVFPQACRSNRKTGMRTFDPFRIAFTVLQGVMLCANLAACQTGDTLSVAELNDGSLVEGRLKSITAEQVKIETEGQEQVLTTASVGSIRCAQGQEPGKAAAHRVVLVDGSVLRCESLTLADRELKLTTACKSELSIATRLIDFVHLLDGSGELDAAWQEIVVTRDQKLQMVDGLIGDISDESVGFTVGERTADVKRARLSGLLFYRRYTESPAPPDFVIELLDGSRIRSRSLTLDGEAYTATTMCGAKLALESEAIALIDFQEGRAIWLTDLEPAGNSWSPLLASSTVLDKLRKFSIAKLDKNFSGKPLEILELNEAAGSLARREYARGFAIKGGGKLSFVLAKQYRKLTSRARHGSCSKLNTKTAAALVTFFTQSI